MNAPARLVTFLVGLVLLFGASYAIAGAVVPQRVVDDWTRSTNETEHVPTTQGDGGTPAHGGSHEGDGS